jgi:hypothetical protein
MLPMATTPFAIRGRIVTGSMPLQMWMSGQLPKRVRD